MVNDHDIKYIERSKVYHEIEQSTLEIVCLILVIVTLVLSATVYMLLY